MARTDGPTGFLAASNDDLLPLVRGLGGRVLAVGDVMLDCFVYGAVSRISPEAPVPVLHKTRTDRMLGGVGNVARNIAALGGMALLAAPVGADANGGVIDTLIAEMPDIRGYLLVCDDRVTTTKIRFVSGGQQILRVDEEENQQLTPVLEDRFIASIADLAETCSAVVISDYRKGALSPRVVAGVIGAATRAKVPVFVDPKVRDVAIYAGATCLTPNLVELALFSGRDVADEAVMVQAAHAMLEAAKAQYVLVTRSEKGMSLITRDAAPLHIPAHTRAVFDVSGAGDTVVGTLALAVASGASWPHAVRLANFAAGVVVGKPGTATCSQLELEAELSDHQSSFAPKVRTLRDAAATANLWKRRGLSVGFTNGCFDLVHPGHVSLLQQARDSCDRLIIGLNSDESVARLKGPTRPVQTQLSRATVLSALTSVDMIVIFEEDTPLNLIGELRPSVLFKGADYTMDQVVGADVVRSHGGVVKLIDLEVGHSTTSIIKRMSIDA